MSKLEDVRWRQRFENFEKSLSHLEAALEIPRPDIVQRAGMVQFFEMTFELAWNTLKDYLEEQGVTVLATPRTVLKKAFEIGLIGDGGQWLKGLEDRNLTSHTYNEKVAETVDSLIRVTYRPLFRSLRDTLKGLRA